MPLAGIFQQAAAKLDMGRVDAEFHPYRELKHTWRRSDGLLHFRVSDYLEGAPDHVLASLATYLLCRAGGKSCPAHSSDAYMRYIRSRELWKDKGGTYLSRSRSLRANSTGSVRDLKEVFDYVNSNYFMGELTEPTLAWVDESPARRLGYYFEPLNLLAVNSSFDSESVPRYALEFVMYHELLHHVDANTGRPRRRVHHTRQFREQERRFSSYAEAEKWLRRIAARGRRRRRGPGVPRV